VVEGTIASSSHASTTQTVNLTGISLAAGTPTKVELGIDTAAFGGRVILDDDGDTYIEAPTDDTIDIYVAGAKDFVITANDFTAQSGSVISTDNINETTSDSGVTIDGVLLKDGNITMSGLAAGSGITLDLAGSADYIIEESSSNDIIDFGQGLGGAFSHNISSGALTIRGASTITTADNTDTLTLISTDADATAGPVLNLFRNSSSPADGDIIGRIKFNANDDGGNITSFVTLEAGLQDASNGSEDTFIDLKSFVAGTERNRLKLNATETVFNEDSADLDFRVESNNNINKFLITAGDDRTHHGGTSHNGSILGVHNFYTGTTTDQPGIILSSNSASYADELLTVGTLRSASASYFLFEGRSGNGSDDAFNDIEFKVNGVGNAFCDGSFSGGGADYAEYFEWKDGNSSAENRRGYSVVLDGNKIVKATDSDDAVKIIGVISAVPVVVGDSDIDRWKEKYLRDDFGSPIMEEFTVTTWRDEANKTDHSYATDRIPTGITAPSDATVITTEADGVTKLIRKKLNPDWNKDTTYISREDRKEWDTVGLMGKLRLRKGQPTGTNWLKMRDISDTVEEWLIR
jgi:hypothetical protein